MSASAIGAKSTLMVQSLVGMRSQLDDLQRQLGTGQKSSTYAGVGLDRGLSVGLRSHLSSINAYGDTITNAGVRIDLAQSALSRMATIGQDVKSAVVNATVSLDSAGQSIPQKTAYSSLGEMLSLLNTQAGTRYLFSGLAGDTPSVDTIDHILNGNGTQAGLKQIISERNQADLGADGLGRLAVSALTSTAASLVGTGATLTADAAASVTGSQDISSLSSAGGTLVINGTNITVNAGDDATTIANAIQAQIGTTGVGAQVLGNNLVLTGVDADTAIDVGSGSTGSLLTELGLSATVTDPNNLLTQGAVAQSQTLNIAVGSNTPLAIVFGTGSGEVSTLAELNAALAGLAGGTASVDGSGNLTVTATNTSDAIALSGSATLANFGLSASTAAAGNAFSLSEDVAGSVFGFKLASVTSNLTGATASGPSGSPPAISVDLGSSNPSAGDTIQFRFTLPDGSTENLTLTATTASPPGPNQFTIGADASATAANLKTALGTAVGTLAGTSLAAASALAASNDFFNIDATHPPQRVDGPPFYTATALKDGTTTDTVTWYTGEAGSAPARSTATAQVDQQMTVSYGLRANEEGIRWLVQNIAVLAVTDTNSADPNAAGRNAALNARLLPALDIPAGTQRIDEIEGDLAGAQTTMAAAKDRHTQTSSTLSDFLESISGVSNEEVASQILALQTSLQASYQTTAMLYQMSLVKYL